MTNKVPHQSIFDADALPPWGPLSPEFTSGDNPKVPPPDWLILAGGSPGDKQKHFEQFVQILFLFPCL